MVVMVDRLLVWILVNHIYHFFMHPEDYAEWFRYILFCVWVIDIILIFLVHHMESCYKDALQNFYGDENQQDCVL